MYRNQLPLTYVIGARLIRNSLGHPQWDRAKPKTKALHFRNEAAKRRTLAKIVAQGKDPEALVKAGLPLQGFAAPNDVIRVPIYEGAAMFLASRARAWARRDARKLEARQLPSGPA